MGVKRHLKNHAEECRKVKSKVTGNTRGQLVLLHDHPEGYNKIQNMYESEELVVGKCPQPNVYHIKPVNANGPMWTVNWHQLQDLGKTQNDGGLASPQDNHDGSQVPSFNLKPNLTKSPLDLHQYAMHSKGRPPMLSLSTTTGVGSTTEISTSSESSFVLGALANLSGFRIMQESASSGEVHFYFCYFCGQHLKLAS